MGEFRSGTLTWDIEAMAKAMILTPGEVREYFTDGRRVSFILERRLSRDVIKGRLAPSEGAGYDLLDAEGGKWEVRTIPKGGIYFCPSYMVGSSRSFNAEGFLAKLEEVRGYILCDIVRFPEIPWWIIPVVHVRRWWDLGKLGTTSKISRTKALDLIRGGA